MSPSILWCFWQRSTNNTHTHYPFDWQRWNKQPLWMELIHTHYRWCSAFADYLIFAENTTPTYTRLCWNSAVHQAYITLSKTSPLDSPRGDSSLMARCLYLDISASHPHLTGWTTKHTHPLFGIAANTHTLLSALHHHTHTPLCLIQRYTPKIPFNRLRFFPFFFMAATPQLSTQKEQNIGSNHWLFSLLLLSAGCYRNRVAPSTHILRWCETFSACFFFYNSY